jgi:hypothetical protein
VSRFRITLPKNIGGNLQRGLLKQEVLSELNAAKLIRASTSNIGVL